MCRPELLVKAVTPFFPQKEAYFCQPLAPLSHIFFHFCYSTLCNVHFWINSLQCTHFIIYSLLFNITNSHIKSIREPIPSVISTAAVHQATEQELERFLSFVFRLRRLLLKHGAARVWLPETCKDRTNSLSNTLRITMREQMLPMAPFGKKITFQPIMKFQQSKRRDHSLEIQDF